MNISPSTNDPEKYLKKRASLIIRRLKVLSNLFFITAFAALAVGASFHGYRIHPEHEETYRIGVAMGISMISAFVTFLISGVVCRIAARKKSNTMSDKEHI